MDDTISRQAAIDAIRASASKYTGVMEMEMYTDDDAVEAINGVPSAQQWTPCRDRLPEEHLCDDGYVEPSDYVLVWGDHGNYGVSRYWGNRRSKSEHPTTYKDWVDLDWIVQKPIAWMPGPEPYKEGQG